MVHRVSNSVYIVKFECVPIVESTSNQQGEAANEGQEQDEGRQREGQEDNEREEVEQIHEQTQLEGATAPIPCTETSSDHSKYQQIYNNFYYTTKLVSTGVLENMAYAGLIYYEEKGVEDLATFTAAKDLNALLEVNIQKCCNDIDCSIYNSLSRKKMLVLKEDRMFILLLNLIKVTLN